MGGAEDYLRGAGQIGGLEMTDALAEPIITKCSRNEIKTILRRRELGHSWVRVAAHVGFCQHTVRRYARVYERYGETAFVGTVKRIGLEDKALEDS